MFIDKTQICEHMYMDTSIHTCAHTYTQAGGMLMAKPLIQDRVEGLWYIDDRLKVSRSHAG